MIVMRTDLMCLVVNLKTSPFRGKGEWSVSRMRKLKKGQLEVKYI